MKAFRSFWTLQRLATGSEIIEKLPFVEVDEEQIVSSTGALALSLGKVMSGTTLRVFVILHIYIYI